MSKINLETIARSIADQTEYNLSEIKKFTDIIIRQMVDYLKNKDIIEIRGLGTFYTKEHKARHVQLKTKIIDSKNHFVILFKSGKELRRIINTERANEK